MRNNDQTGTKSHRNISGKRKYLYQIRRFGNNNRWLIEYIWSCKCQFDNNQAERDLQNVNTKNKVIGCFRVEQGAQNYLDIMSFLNTGLKQGIGVVESLSATFVGYGNIVIR